MLSARPHSSSGEQTGNWFATTHWSVILAAQENHSPQSAEALERLCRTYWYPLYAYLRRRGYAAHDAEDLTQEFFARLFEKNYLGSVDRAKGKFRSFLLASLNHFLANEWDKAQTVKRGGKFTFISLDEKAAEDQYLREPISDSTPERIFDQRWAEALLAQVLVRLRKEYHAAGKTELFDRIKVFLTGEKKSVAYAELAAQLKTTEGASKMAVQRMRHRYRDLLRSEVAHTVAGPDDIEDELRSLLAALA